MNDNLTPSLSRALASVAFEAIGKPSRRANEVERDRAAIELAAYVIGILKFDAGAVGNHGPELLKRANKVRRVQGNGEIAFINDTAEKIRAAAQPSIPRAPDVFDSMEALMVLLMNEPTP